MKKDTKVGLQLLGIAGVLGLVLFFMSTGKTAPVVAPLARGTPAPRVYPDYTSYYEAQAAAQTQYLRELRDMAEQELRDAEFERKFGFRRAR